MTKYRKQLQGEAGFTIIEVIVSAVIMVVLSTAIFGALNSTGRAAAQERHRARAYSIAQDDQARLRSLKVSDVARLSQVTNVTEDGITYTITSMGTPKIDRTATTSCESGNTSADYIAISSTVTWTSIGTRPPVKIESIITPPNGSLSDDRGAFSASVTDSRNLPLSGFTINGSGPSPFSGTTGTTGCVIFGDLLAGNYTVTPSGPAGYVDNDGNPPAPIATSVVGQSSNTAGFQYDKGGTVKATFTTIKPGSTTPVASSADSMMVFNTGMTQAERFGTLGTDLQIQTGTPLFPFTSPDQLYAGACTTNNPALGGYTAPTAAFGSVLVPQSAGTAATQTVQLPALAMTVKSGTSSSSAGTNVNAARVTAIDQNCVINGTAVKRVLATGSAGTLAGTSAISADNPGLPYGINYDICISGPSNASGSPIKRITKTGVALNNITTPTNLGTIYLNSGTAGACP